MRRNVHTVALGRLGLPIHPREGRNEEQLCAAATSDKLPRFTSPEPCNSQRELVSGSELKKCGEQPKTQMGLKSLRDIVVVTVIFKTKSSQLVVLFETLHDSVGQVDERDSL